ncbi:hypothetical protein ABT061_26385 [Streptosporangium sp. NPDC002544]|uniref:hypothetical protein n=1 Tax=Streptosporangium sp. NPDC002544 TaxID=3154538 RepID=UPI003329BA28
MSFRAIRRLSTGQPHRYVNILGANTARQCLVFVVPVMLGDGVRLFDHPGGTDVKLERVELTEVPHATSIRFRVVG